MMFSEEQSDRSWTKEEDEYAKEYKQNWADAPQFLNPMRTSTDYKMRYTQLTNKKTGAWTVEEDRKLMELIQIHGEGNWSDIANGLPNRTGKQCRDHFTNQLDPKINKSPWTEKEDKLLLDLYKEYHNQWRLIRMRMNRRSELQIKNRFKKLTNYLEEGPIETYSNNEILNLISSSKHVAPNIIFNSTKCEINLNLSKKEEFRMEKDDDEEDDDDEDDDELYLSGIIRNEINRFSMISKYELNPYTLRKGIILFKKFENYRSNRNSSALKYTLSSLPLPLSTLPLTPHTQIQQQQPPLLQQPQQPQQQQQQQIIIDENTRINLAQLQQQINQPLQFQIIQPQPQQQQIYQIPLPPSPTLSEDMEDNLENTCPALVSIQSEQQAQLQLQQQQQQQQILLSPIISIPIPSPPPPPHPPQAISQPVASTGETTTTTIDITNTASTVSSTTEIPNSNNSNNGCISSDIPPPQEDQYPIYVTYYPANNNCNNNNSTIFVDKDIMKRKNKNVNLKYVKYNSIDSIGYKNINEIEDPFYALKNFFESIEKNRIQVDLPFTQRFPRYYEIDVDAILKLVEEEKRKRESEEREEAEKKRHEEEIKSELKEMEIKKEEEESEIEVGST